MKSVSKSLSIYIALMILFSINFKNVCIGEGEQNTKHSATQAHDNKEKEPQSQKEDMKSLLDYEKETKKLDVEHSTVSKEQITEGDYVFRYDYDGYHRFMDRSDDLYERNYLYNDYFYDERDIDESSETCSCCTIV